MATGRHRPERPHHERRQARRLLGRGCHMNDVPSLPFDVLAAVRRAAMPDLSRWRQMIHATGGCAQPIRLQGERYTVDVPTGEVVESYRTADEPTGYLLTACGNRRASQCPACSEVYRDDTFHLIISGLQGGKGVPEEVSVHPRMFATFTAPSFGSVHARRVRDGKTLPCRPRRDDPLCAHGRPEGCRVRHGEDDSRLGQPICVDCYDYSGAVLWNAHAGELWRRFTRDLSQCWLGNAGCPGRTCGGSSGCPTPRLPNTRRGAWSTSML